MSAIPFLLNRQIGNKLRPKHTSGNYGLNLDNVISRLVCHTNDIFTVGGLESDVPPFACKFRRDAQCDLLTVSNEDGYISIYNTVKKQNSLIKVFLAHNNAIFDICWLPDKCQLICGAGDHSASLWDIARVQRLSVYNKHCASVKSVDVCPEQSAIFATGSRDGSINIWDAREKVVVNGKGKPAIIISDAHLRKCPVIKRRSMRKGAFSSVSGVAFQNENHLASVGVGDGVVKIWDLRRTYVVNSKYLPTPKYKMDYGEGQGCTSLVFDSHHRNLYACSTSNQIFKFNCHSYVKEDTVYNGFQCLTYFIKLDISKDDQYLVCGSSNESAYIWKTSQPGPPIVKLSAHAAEVTSVAWSPYGASKLVTCGDDSKVAIWRMADTETVSHGENIHAIVEQYRESPKNEISSNQVSVRSSITGSNVTIRKSPVEVARTPRKPSIRVITSFFSPLTPREKNELNNTSSSSCDSSSPSEKISDIDTSIPSQILTPNNCVNKDNIMVSSSEGSLNTLSSPELKNSSPEAKNCDCVPIASTSAGGKENTSTDLSPEMVRAKNNADQSKRKITSKHSTPVVKKKKTETSRKSRGNVNVDKKATSGKTIMNYFRVILSPDN